MIQSWRLAQYTVSQTHHYMPQASHMFWLADGFDHMSKITEIDASLVKGLFKRSSVHGCLVGMEAPIHLITNIQIHVMRLFHVIRWGADCRM